ncbi:MAG: presqualene diphosphate synthase HpnD [Alphaproteobacteria bacterium]
MTQAGSLAEDVGNEQEARLIEEARHHVSALTRASGTSFYWGMRILPPARREAMFAIYAFCREVDDIADGSLEPAGKRAALEDWRQEIQNLYLGRANKAVTRALLPALRDCKLRREDFLAIIDGMEMDAAGPIVAPRRAELERYCDRVAGAVGLLSIRAFGDSSSAAEDFALALGRALQLTNILRDLKEDAAIGRLYLPRETLLAHGISPDDPAAVLDHPNLPGVCAEIAAEAARHYALADRLRPRLDRHAMRPAFIMGALYRRVLNKLVRRGWHDLDRDVRVSKPVKLAIILRYALT